MFPLMRANPKQVGTVTEARVFAALVAEFDTVLLPFGDNSRYDLVVDHAGTFLRIQCKTARRARTDGAIVFPAASSQFHRGKARQGYVGSADYFGVATVEDPRVFLVPVPADERVTEMSLRLSPTLSGRVKGCHFADEYEVSVQAAAIRARLEGESSSA